AGLSPVHSAFFTDPPTTAASTLSLHDALPICGFLRRMSNACQFDAVHARCGYALLLKFDLDAAAQLARDLILPCRRRPHLQSYRSEERRVGKVCSRGWGPSHATEVTYASGQGH